MAFSAFAADGVSHAFNYDAPASVWNEALPLGNGRIGAMVFGAPGMERVELNEETYWAGGPHETVVRGLKPLIDEARRRILVGDADQLPSVGPGNVFSAVIRSDLSSSVAAAIRPLWARATA